MVDNIFEINDLSNLKMETYDGSNFWYMDNFYKYPDLVYSYITSTEPPIWKEWEQPSNNMVYFEDRRHMIDYDGVEEVTRSLGKIIGQQSNNPKQITTNFTRFVKHPFNNYKDYYWWPHIDSGYNAIVYLNREIEEEYMGTHIYKKLVEDDDNEKLPEHYQPWHSKNDWEILFSFKALYNRLVIFDGKKYYHAMDVSDDRFFGDTLDEANFRINQVMFFDQECYN